MQIAQKRLVTAGQVEVLAVTTIAPVITFRFPRPKEVDPFFGGARTFWNQRTSGVKPDVESYVVKQPGCKRGIRFISFESALNYFERLRASQQKDNPNSK